MSELIIQSRNEERNKNQNLNNEDGIISKIARIALTTSLTNKALSKTRFKDSKYNNIIGIGLGIALNLKNDENEEDITKTILAAGTLLGGSNLLKKNIKENGELITKSIFNFNQKNINFRETIFDFNQRRKEAKAGINGLNTIEKKLDYIWDFSQSSKAKELYNEASSTNNFIKYSTAKNSYVDPLFGNYFSKKDQINKRGGFGFFDRTLKNLKISENGDIVFNEKQILGSRSEFNVTKTFLNHFKNELIDYNSKAEDFNMDNFLDFLETNNKEKNTNLKLITDFKKHYKTISSNNDGVKLKDLFDQQNIKESIKQQTSGLSFLNSDVDEDKVLKLFADINVKDLSKDKNGKIFDSSILDSENLFLDTMQMIDKSIRPPFSFIPGEKQNFSIVPFDIKARILSKESSNFKIIQTETDYDGTIAELKKMKTNVINNNYKKLNTTQADLEAQKSGLLSEIEEKINYFEYEKDFINRTGAMSSDIKKTKTKFFLNYEDNILKINESKEKDIKAYINNDKEFNYLNNDNVWKQKEGKYGFTYSQIFKNNESSKYDATLAEDFGDYGQFSEGLNEDSAFGTIKKKFNNWLDKDKKIFSEEVNKEFDIIKNNRNTKIDELYNKKYKDTYNSIDDFKEAIYKNDFIDFEGFDDLKKLIQTEKAYIYKSGINTKSLFDLNLQEGDNLNNIKDFDITLKEQFMKNLLNTDYFKNNKENLFNGKYFNTEYLKENYYKSLIPSKRGMIYRESESISDWFTSYKDKIGTLENSYFNNFFNKFEDSLNFIGQKKLNPSENYSTNEHLSNIMLKRVMPFLGMVYGYQFVEGLTDILTPDDTVFGNAGIGGTAAKILAGTRLGMQVIAENTGIKSATQYAIDQGLGFLEVFDLHLSSEEMYQRYFEGKLTPIKRNRYWFSSGRDGFEGGDIKEYRQHFLYKMQNRDEKFYNSKTERFLREDFVLTKYASRLIDPYLEERRLFEKGLPLDKSEQLFRDIPIFGELLNSTIGEIIKPTIYYSNNKNEMAAPLRVVNSALEDLKSFGGLQGYALSKTTDFLFGGKSIKDIMLNHGFETRELASVDAITSLSSQFNNLELGGMFGFTEPLRRLLPDNFKERKSNMQNNLPKWFSETNRKNNLELLNENNLNPFNYKKQFDLNQDQKYTDYGLIDRLSIMANTNPNSSEFYNYKNMAIANMNKGIYDNKQIINIMQSISIAENLNNYNEYKKDLFVPDAKFEKMSLKIDNVISHNEFISNGKRIKLAGISNDFEQLQQKIGSHQALSEINKMKNILSNTDSLNLLGNQDMLKNVKSDSKGQYIELFSNDLYKESKLKERTYFEQAYNNNFNNFINKYFDLAVSQTFDVTKNKLFSNKTATEEWEDNLTIPTFRDWDRPVESFIEPFGDLANGDLSQNFLAKQILVDNTLTKDSSTISGLGLSYLAGKKLFGESNTNYKRESKLNELYQKTLYDNGINSTYDINENSSNTEIRKTLTQNDQKFFYSLMNEVNDDKIKKIKNQGNHELIKAYEIMQNKKMNYLYNTNIITEQTELPEKENPNFSFQYNYFYNTAKIKQSNNLNLTLLEKRKLNNFNFDQNEMNMQISEEEIRKRLYRNRNSKVISNIYDNNNSFLF